MAFGNSSQEDNMMSEINVTPLVDVMLVLLVVFIITAPLLAPQSLKINLPKTDAVQQNEKPQKVSLVVRKATSILIASAWTTEVWRLPCNNMQPIPASNCRSKPIAPCLTGASPS